MGRSRREVAPFAASRNLARCSFAVHRKERASERAREGRRKRGMEGTEKEIERNLEAR